MKRSRVGLAVWLLAVAVYGIGVAGRTSFGVAGLTAIDRFGISAATLSLFTIVQVTLYAGAQIPVGFLLDKFGSRILLGSGALILAVGQLGMAFASSVQMALAARILVGLGDATAFTSVIRIVPAWFSPRRAPVLMQLTGIIGGLGQVISSLPFVYIMDRAGWTSAFAALAILGVAVSGLAFAFIRDNPSKWHYTKLDTTYVPNVVSGSTAPSTMTVRQALFEPATQLAFWTHWSGNFPNTLFVLLWGVPFLQIHDGYSQVEASALLVIVTFSGMVLGPLVGELTARHTLRRVWIINGSNLLVFSTWAAILLLPAPTPRPLTWFLLVMLALSGVSSSVAFDFVRTAIPLERFGIANGLANMGGFIATLCLAGIVGLSLDYTSQGSPLAPVDFKIAMSYQVIFWLIGMIGIEFARRKMRRREAEEGIRVPPLREVMARYRRP